MAIKSEAQTKTENNNINPEPNSVGGHFQMGLDPSRFSPAEICTEKTAQMNSFMHRSDFFFLFFLINQYCTMTRSSVHADVQG